MTMLSPTLLPSVRPARPTLTTDVDQLRDLAEQLNGRPVPGVRMTERQFVNWCSPSGLPAEWVDGEVFLMPSPSVTHVRLSGWLFQFLTAFVELHDLGEVLLPLTVRLDVVPARRDPDVPFVAKSRLHLLRENHLEGPPDLAVEIVSPDSVERDWQTKHGEYAAAGVREYWVVDPMNKLFAPYGLRGGQYRRLVADKQGRVQSRVLKGLFVRAEWLWRSPLPRVATVLREVGVR